MSRRLTNEEKARRQEDKERLKRQTDEYKENAKQQKSVLTFSLQVLTNKSLSLAELSDVWGDDVKRYPETAVQMFIRRNEEALRFLDIEASGDYNENGKYELILTTSNYIGCVPLRSPRTGSPIGNLIITGRFGEDVSELLSIIGDFVEPEFSDKMALSKGSYIKPPLYFECQNYIDHYIDAKKYKWRKFDSIEQIEPRPTNSTKWGEYALKSYDPRNTLRYPNRKNILSKNHREWEELNYVLNLCIDEVMSSRTPVRSRMAYNDKILNLLNSYDRHALPIVSEVKVHMSDPIVIKELKTVANRVLKNDLSSHNAWRLDFAEFFERYVQFLFKEVARVKGARCLCNPHYSVFGNRPAWSLKYLEPDIIIDKAGAQVVVDAKYKAHIYQINSDGEQFKESFREDFHQVLAYSSFGGCKQKTVILVYPSNSFMSRSLDVVSGINGYSSKVLIVGVPLKKSELEETINRLSLLVEI